MGRMQGELTFRSRSGLLAYAMNLTVSLTKGRSLLTALLVPILLLSHIAAAQEVAQDTSGQKDYVSVVLPYPVDEVYDRAAALFDSSKRDFYEDYNAKIYALPEPVQSFKDLSPKAHRQFMALPIVRPNKFYVFFGAYPNVQGVIAGMTPLAAMGHSNAALQRYASLPMGQRKYDLYLWSPDTPYWYSEYTIGGKPAPFKSFFILHLTPEGADRTEAEIIENKPVIRFNTPSVDVHGVMRNYDEREVEPTTRDREFLLSCLSQFIERHVPGRHWFSCREKGEVVEEPIPFTVP